MPPAGPQPRQSRDAEVRPPHHRRPRPPRHADPEPRRRADAHLHAGGHLWHGQGRHAALAGGHGRADHPRQHLPFVDAAGPGRHPAVRRPAPLRELAQAHPDRLRRLPGLEPGRDAQDQRGGGQVRVAGQRRQALPDARDQHADPDGAELRHRHAVRRVHALREQGQAHDRTRGAAVHGDEPALGAALHHRVRAAGEPECAVRHRAGRHVHESARRLAGRPGRPGSARLCDRRAERGRAQGRDAAHPRAHRPPAAGPQAALSDGRGHARGPGRRCEPGHRHVRLRDAHPQCAQRPPVHPFW
mmetsp:Transcript_875/g.1992  ORF Transcript_875/g.1992 Transcript_875/m.1992 type:complete len:301 (-) Transcript_875:873-1775(-)